MAVSDRAQLFSRLQELRSQQGMGWKEIARIVEEEEGYREKGKSLTDNALRKRYARWVEAEGAAPTTSELVPKQEHGGYDFDQPQKSGMESSLNQLEGAALPALLPEDAIVSSIAGLVSVNNQLLEQIQQSHRILEGLGQRLEELTLQTAHTGIDSLVTSRDLLELLRDMGAGRQEMKFIEEKKEYDVSREEIQQLIEETVGDRVDTELKSMLSAEGSFSLELAHLIDNRLKTLFSGAEPVSATRHAGPGRGKRGKTHKKFSASLEQSLFERVRSLPGQFSGHLSNALEVYLSVVEEKKPE